MYGSSLDLKYSTVDEAHSGYPVLYIHVERCTGNDPKQFKSNFWHLRAGWVDQVCKLGFTQLQISWREVYDHIMDNSVTIG